MLTAQRALVRMPDVVGLPLRKAKLLVQNAGLVVDAITFMESYETRDNVLGQKPMRGQMVYAGDKVTLTVSRESYVKWLPSIYQRADINGRNFYRDFLWIVQHLFGSIEEILDVIHQYFDPYESPEKYLPWLASWSAMILEEDWPLAKKRRLIRKAIELYRIRGTVKGIKLFISLFTGHEPDIKENQWPFRGWRIGESSEIGTDSVVLPPVNLAHTFIVEMPVSYKDVSPEAVIRIHEIIQMEKPANTQYYLRFASEGGGSDLSEFMAIGGGVIGGIGLGAGDAEAITSEADLKKAEAEASRADIRLPTVDMRKTQMMEIDAAFQPMPRTKPPLPKAPRADLAPVEGKEGPRSSKAGGFEGAAREMAPISATQAMEVMKTEIEPPPEKAPEKASEKADDKKKADDKDAKKTKVGREDAKPDPKKDPEKK
ncbi:MAG TPA: phage tail protein I [Polyangia bacterium]|jgi:phage tail-like protein